MFNHGTMIISNQLTQASFPCQPYGRKYNSFSPALSFRTYKVLLSEGQCKLHTKHRNIYGGFCANETTTSSYNISPSEYFDDVERNLGYYKQPPLSVTRVQYFEIIQRLAASESRDNQAWVAPGSACVDLVQFQRASTRR